MQLGADPNRNLEREFESGFMRAVGSWWSYVSAMFRFHISQQATFHYYSTHSFHVAQTVLLSAFPN